MRDTPPPRAREIGQKRRGGWRPARWPSPLDGRCARSLRFVAQHAASLNPVRPAPLGTLQRSGGSRSALGWRRPGRYGYSSAGKEVVQQQKQLGRGRHAALASATRWTISRRERRRRLASTWMPSKTAQQCLGGRLRSRSGAGRRTVSEMEPGAEMWEQERSSERPLDAVSIVCSGASR